MEIIFDRYGYLISLIAMITILLLLLGEAINWRKKRSIYIDRGKNDKIYKSEKYRIVAKPDVVLDKHTIEEIKNRESGLYSSDRAQMIATALAVRSSHRITKGVLVTKNARYDVSLEASDRKLFELIREDYNHAVTIASGRIPPGKPAEQKCRSCEYRERCKYSL